MIGDCLSSKPKIIIAGIGTGGHYFPAAVVAEELSRKKLDVIFLVRKGFMEDKIAKEYEFKTFYIEAKPFYGKGIYDKLLFIFSLIYSIYKINPIVKNNVGLVFGGFGSLPLVISCMLNRKKFYIFEPNRIPGKATKLFARNAKKIFLGLPIVKEIRDDTFVTGIPIRSEFKMITHKRSAKISKDKKLILFYGGSQGAHRLNILASELQKILPKKYLITIVSGQRDHEWLLKEKDQRTRVIPFTDTPWKEIAKADAVISRSGALAGYEILSLRKKAIFIPFPYAIDNHQYYNAEYFAEVGGATMIEEKILTKELLAEKIEGVLKKKMERGKKIILDAEKRIAAAILEDIDVR